MTKMQVKVNIHESLIKKIKVGQKAEIRIESFPSIVFVGTVTRSRSSPIRPAPG